MQQNQCEQSAARIPPSWTLTPSADCAPCKQEHSYLRELAHTRVLALDTRDPPLRFGLRLVGGVKVAVAGTVALPAGQVRIGQLQLDPRAVALRIVCGFVMPVLLQVAP